MIWRPGFKGCISENLPDFSTCSNTYLYIIKYIYKYLVKAALVIHEILLQYQYEGIGSKTLIFGFDAQLCPL